MTCARRPWLSGPVAGQEDRHEAVARGRALLPGAHFTVDQAARTASLTEAGLTAIEGRLGIDNLYDAANGGLAHLVENAARALAYERDRDYLVSGDQVMLIDQKSGRPLQSRYADGVHEALEAKERLPVHRDQLGPVTRRTGCPVTAATVRKSRSSVRTVRRWRSAVTLMRMSTGPAERWWPVSVRRC